MTTVTIYNETTGAIRKVVSSSTPHLQCPDGTKFIKGEYDDRFFRINVGGGRHFAEKKPEMQASVSKDRIVANGFEEARIVGIPPETQVTVKAGKEVQDSFAVNDGVLELTFDTPGVYVVRLSNELYLPQEVEVHAT